ncbi:MAG: HEAT repeat domain-containing protein [Chloroflexota bacterium]
MTEQNLIETWIADLDSDEILIRQSAIDNLLAAAAGAVEPLIAAMQRQKGRQAWEAAAILAQIDDPRWIQPMKNMLMASNLIIASIAAATLERFGESVVGTFIDALPKCRAMTQMQIVGILERIGDRRCVDLLMDLLSTADSADFQYTIIQTLGALGDARAAELIRSFQHHENHHIRKRAQAALRRLESQSSSSDHSS